MSSLQLALKPHGLPGRLVVFSGVDGSSKSTLINFAVDSMKAFQKKAILIDLLDDRVRELSDFRDYCHDPLAAIQRVNLLALSLICAGSRLQNLHSRVIPALAAGFWVFCDRYIYTTWAEYLALSSPSHELEILRQVLELFPKPDLGFLPYAGAQTCIARVSERVARKNDCNVPGRPTYH
jgi:thymidylate kinase